MDRREVGRITDTVISVTKLTSRLALEVACMHASRATGQQSQIGGCQAKRSTDNSLSLMSKVAVVLRRCTIGPLPG